MRRRIRRVARAAIEAALPRLWFLALALLFVLGAAASYAQTPVAGSIRGRLCLARAAIGTALPRLWLRGPLHRRLIRLALGD